MTSEIHLGVKLTIVILWDFFQHMTSTLALGIVFVINEITYNRNCYQTWYWQ